MSLNYIENVSLARKGKTAYQTTHCTCEVDEEDDRHEDVADVLRLLDEAAQGSQGVRKRGKLLSECDQKKDEKQWDENAHHNK